MGQLDKKTVLAALDSNDPKVRATAIRVSDLLLKTTDPKELVEKFSSMAGKDRQGDVQLQLASTLGEMGGPKRSRECGMIARNSASNVYIRDAILSGTYKRKWNFWNH